MISLFPEGETIRKRLRIVDGIVAAPCCTQLLLSLISFLLTDDRLYGGDLFCEIEVKLLFALALIVQIAYVMALVPNRAPGSSQCCVGVGLAETPGRILAQDFTRRLGRKLSLGRHGYISLIRWPLLSEG